MPDGPLNAGSEPLPALRRELLQPRDAARLEQIARAEHAPRILLLYGSLRERSYSRLLIEEADRLLRLMGAETRIFDPRELPIANSTGPDHPKVQELLALSLWSEGQVWCSPEMHGAVTGVFKNQIDWLPLEIGSVRPTQGRTLAVMQVSGGSQSFNAVNTLRLLDSGCGCSPSRTSRACRVPMSNSMTRAE
jgi:arsenic resistance protein ArsH